VRFRGREDILIDVFHGRVLADEALAARLRQALGRDVVFHRMELEAITPHAFLVRLVSNLKRHTALAGDFQATLLCCERLLQLQPDDPEELRDRGLVYAQLDCVGAARDDLTRFLALAPSHPSAGSIQARLQQLEGRRVVLN
jgi:regulator of sirC expression with transglutaminase-like and TPR domain